MALDDFGEVRVIAFAAAEVAAPQSRGAHQNYLGRRKFLKDARGAAVAAELLALGVVDAPRRIEEQVVACLERLHALADLGDYGVVARHAGDAEVWQGNEAQGLPDVFEGGVPEVLLVRQGARMEAVPEHAGQQQRVDERRMVRQKEHAAPRVDFFQAPDGDAVAQPEGETSQQGEEKCEELFHFALVII